MNKKNNKEKLHLLLSYGALIVSCILLAASYAWFIKEREMSSVAWVKTPIILEIGAGNHHAIQYLDMGDIDVDSATYKDYVICVYGKPVDNYSLQLAYTTNIAFHYDVFRAQKVEDENDADETIKAQFGSDVEKYKIISLSEPVINGLSMDEVKSESLSPAQFQSHKLSYSNDDDVVEAGKVQGFNEPFYFLAQENGISVMQPLNKNESDGSFLDYYVIRVSWDPKKVKNDKETDIVCISASR